jgi:hypothetical protein
MVYYDFLKKQDMYTLKLPEWLISYFTFLKSNGYRQDGKQ